MQKGQQSANNGIFDGSDVFWNFELMKSDYGCLLAPRLAWQVTIDKAMIFWPEMIAVLTLIVALSGFSHIFLSLFSTLGVISWEDPS
jgi:hypothetical protein